MICIEPSAKPTLKCRKKFDKIRINQDFFYNIHLTNIWQYVYLPIIFLTSLASFLSIGAIFAYFIDIEQIE